MFPTDQMSDVRPTPPGHTIADLVSFDVTGLTLQRSSPQERLWATPRGLSVLLTVGHAHPGYLGSAGDEEARFAEYRRLVAGAGGGLAELTFPYVDGCRANRMIVKGEMDPATGYGRIFRGILEIPIGKSSVVVKVECAERGTTGWRETDVIHRLLASGTLAFKSVPPEEESRMLGAADMVGWLVDPLDPTPAHLACNASDDRKYDADFPDHPLSLVREFLDRTERSISLARELKLVVAYHGGSKPKPWWKIW